MIWRRVCGLAYAPRRQYPGSSLTSPELDGERPDILIEAAPGRASRRRAKRPRLTWGLHGVRQIR